jgi:hypothetical protein
MLKSGHDPKWVTIKDKSMLRMLLLSYADNDKKKILEVATKPKTIPDIVVESKLPRTSTYRKINSLLQEYLLLPVGHILLENGKLVTKYVALFEKLEIHTEKEISITAQISKEVAHILLKIVGERPGSTIEEKIIRKIKHSQNEREMIRRLLKHIKKRGSNKVILDGD